MMKSSIAAALKYAESHAERYVELAFRGDPEAAFRLCAALGNENRGIFAELMWLAKVPREAYRAFLSSAWDHDHRHVINVAMTKRTLAAMFRYAAFPIPAHIGDTVRVWRGASALSIAEARAGFCWTLDRDVACWFAMRFAEHNGSPLVLTAEIPRSAIALYTNEREEEEVVLFKAPAAIIDGEVSDWRGRYATVEATLQR